MEDKPVLETKNLKKYYSQSTNIIETIFGSRQDHIQAVDDVSLTLEQNQTQGIIGESGCGKTTLLETLIGLLTPTDGEIYFRGSPVSEFSRQDWKEYRGNVQIIFQDPFNALDPRMTVRESLHEPMKIHGMGSWEEREDRIHEIMEQVALAPPERYLDNLPEQLSGGELQRASIARALVVDPDIILADEPVSMLDVSTQASILTMLSRLVDEFDLSMFYISHDLSTVSYVCDIVNVMYLGRIVESAETLDLINDPKHPYSQALIQAVPKLRPDENRERVNVEGTPKVPVNLGNGCRFRDRCPERMEICDKTPAFIDYKDGRKTACHLYYDHAEGMNIEAGVEESRIQTDGSGISLGGRNL